MKRNKLRLGRIVALLVVLILLVAGGYLMVDRFVLAPKRPFALKDFTEFTKEKVDLYAKEYDINVKYSYEYDEDVKKGTVLRQITEKGTKIKKKDTIEIVLSKGEIPVDVYLESKVNELGKIPVMMYHGIVNMPSSETKYTGGNVDREGYNRTVEAFRKDLDFYYAGGYRMIRLMDYINGNIDVPLGKSPIVLTFDDGDENNFKVTGVDSKGNLQIDPNCAVGILEEYKKKYPDFQVTATFFLNSKLFGQKEYNEEIMKWLVAHGYDIGNHTMSHPDFTKISKEKTLQEVGGIYEKLEKILPGKYIPVVALPFGSPYKTEHENFASIMKGEYNGKSYETKAALRVGWQADSSPFSVNFDPTFIKRIRAYDHDGTEFDIAMCFKIIEETKYISDGDKKTVVIMEEDEDYIVKTDKKVITY